MIVLILGRDGFAADEFHRRCDNKGATLTIIKEKGGVFGKPSVFGAYISESWESPVEPITKLDPKAFLFTLINPHNLPPIRFYPQNNTPSFRCDHQWGPQFRDINISSHSNINYDSYIYFPYKYVDTALKGSEVFLQSNLKNKQGCPHFTVSDIEIYSVL